MNLGTRLWIFLLAFMLLVAAVTGGFIWGRASGEGDLSARAGQLAPLAIRVDGRLQVAPPTIRVNEDLQPAYESLPAFEDGTPRPVAVITGDDDQLAMFIENELWLSTDQETELEEFLDQWQGTVLLKFDPSEYGIDDFEPQYLIRVVTDEAATEQLGEDLQRLDPTSTGEFAVSSEEGLSLISAAAMEAVGGLPVGLNWIGQNEEFGDRMTVEAPSGPNLSGVAYDPNSFTWPSHSTGSNSVLNIGVAEAWRALEAAGIDGTIGLAILDMGFEPDADWPTGWLAISNVPFVDPTGTSNLLDCGSPCPWHGTNVVSAAMAVPDNQFGSAGPAGPVADAVAVFTTYDMFMSITALGEARIAGARIANMSYGAPVPWYLSWSVLPFEATTLAFRNTGMLIFAAAGNDGKNVDKVKCSFWGTVCFERTWYTPCENAGVICVGGTGGNGKSRASGSNYGSEQVDIFAPYTLWLGPDPSSSANAVRAKNGTSFSSPFAAGVAALIWAADPSMGADTVESILLNTAHWSPDPQVRRYVNALGAVRSVLGNIPPEITIVSPSESQTLHVNLPSNLWANVSDFEDGGFSCCDVVWEVVGGGQLGVGASLDTVFDEIGSFTLVATATDTGGFSAQAVRLINVVNTDPEVTILSPVFGGEVFAGVSFLAQGASFDINEQGPLDCGALAWTTEVAGELATSGCSATITLTELGSRQLALTATDPQGASSTTSIDIDVVPAPANLPPVVQIVSPQFFDSIGGNLVTLEGLAVDPEGDSSLEYEWVLTWPYDSFTRSGDNIDVLGTGPSFGWVPSSTIAAIGTAQEFSWELLLELRVTDSGGSTGVAALVLRITQIN